jgi:hypothetical protein
MPSSFLAVDTNFPTQTGNTAQDMKKILNYLFMLTEQLRYTLYNLSPDNFNEAALIGFGETITDPIYVRIANDEDDIAQLSLTAQGLTTQISDAEGNISALDATATSLTSRVSTAEGNISTVTQTADKINWVVKSGTSSANFLLTDRAISLVANEIDLSGYVTISNLQTSGMTTINGDNIVTGTISADRIDVSNLKVQKIYTSTAQVALTSSGTSDLRIGGDGYWNYLNTYIYAGTAITFGDYSYAARRVVFDITNKKIKFGDTNWNLGESATPLALAYIDEVRAAQIGASLNFVGTAYITGLNFGGNATYCIKCDSRQLYPSSTSTSYPSYIGTSTYPWHYAYIGSNTCKIGTTSSSKLSFFGATAIARQTISLSSNDMGYTSVTASNYLYALNNIIGILKNKYGLIG